jgi:hypothetical protein
LIFAGTIGAQLAAKFAADMVKYLLSLMFGSGAKKAPDGAKGDAAKPKRKASKKDD